MATILPGHRMAQEAGDPLAQLARRRTRLPQRRFALAGLVIVAATAYLIVASFSAAVASVVSPDQLLGRGQAIYGQSVRLEGQVAGAYAENSTTLAYRFHVSDGHASIVVSYSGDLPGGFKTGASVEAQGTYNGRVFTATSLTAKCPTKYQAAPARS